MKSAVIVSFGTHAQLLFEILKIQNKSIVGYTDVRDCQSDKLTYLGNDSIFGSLDSKEIFLVNGIGTSGKRNQSQLRKNIYNTFSEKFEFATILHPGSIISPSAIIEKGAQVMAGAIIQTSSRIGYNTIINTRASVDHNCIIGDHVHISPGAVLCGEVTVNSGSHIGAGATIIQNVTIGHNVVVAAGAVVIDDVPDGAVVMGVPAKRR
ncbi:acetyltransferase [Paenibacillus alginolyticus]|uniref:Acetyltransferase n=1 Tax=Paenibacillus alginolyticus TaxID=59839 RepID=A0ABT4G8Q5_9BACL|nr:acetyltransferase [Paenibacillus alginolyticus]MCY9692554.1 acetyltransferase [Paenibacillus alginolyticus]MEC0143760.1 acetyltransferase [Paenibacillus alginolyticus]